MTAKADAGEGADASAERADAAPVPCDDGFAGPECEECVVYVASEAAGDEGTGLSWDDAKKTVQAGMELAGARRLADGLDACSVWVRAGTYRPGTERTDSFQLASGVHLYGGFSGDETRRDQRDLEEDESILSGDLSSDDAPNAPDTLDDNAYHVLRGADGSVLDGFTVTAGVADGESPDDDGGGMYNVEASPTVTNVTFSGNRASFGGAMSNSASDPVLTNVTFSGNRAQEGTVNGGGAMFNGSGSAPVLTNVTFSGNSSDHGGAIYNDNAGAPLFTNVTFSGNRAQDSGGAMASIEGSAPVMFNVAFFENIAQEGDGGALYNVLLSAPLLTNATFFDNSANIGGGMYVGSSAETSIRNSIFWKNQAAESDNEIHIAGNGEVTISHSIVQGGQPTGALEFSASLSDDPSFVDESIADLRLRPGSPAIDAGDSLLPNLPETDLEGNPRIVAGEEGAEAVIDIGAYEHQP